MIAAAADSGFNFFQGGRSSERDIFTSYFVIEIQSYLRFIVEY